MATKKPRLSIVLDFDEKSAFADLAQQYSLAESTFGSYCLRYFIYNFNSPTLPALNKTNKLQMELELDT